VGEHEECLRLNSIGPVRLFAAQTVPRGGWDGSETVSLALAAGQALAKGGDQTDIIGTNTVCRRVITGLITSRKKSESHFDESAEASRETIGPLWSNGRRGSFRRSRKVRAMWNSRQLALAGAISQGQWK